MTMKHALKALQFFMLILDNVCNEFSFRYTSLVSTFLKINRFRITHSFIQGHIKRFNAYTFLKRDLRMFLYGMGLHRQPCFGFN